MERVQFEVVDGVLLLARHLLERVHLASQLLESWRVELEPLLLLLTLLLLLEPRDLRRGNLQCGGGGGDPCCGLLSATPHVCCDDVSVLLGCFQLLVQLCVYRVAALNVLDELSVLSEMGLKDGELVAETADLGSRRRPLHRVAAAKALPPAKLAALVQAEAEDFKRRRAHVAVLRAGRLVESIAGAGFLDELDCPRMLGDSGHQIVRGLRAHDGRTGHGRDEVAQPTSGGRGSANAQRYHIFV